MEILFICMYSSTKRSSSLRSVLASQPCNEALLIGWCIIFNHIHWAPQVIRSRVSPQDFPPRRAPGRRRRRGSVDAEPGKLLTHRISSAFRPDNFSLFHQLRAIALAGAYFRMYHAVPSAGDDTMFPPFFLFVFKGFQSCEQQNIFLP